MFGTVSLPNVASESGASGESSSIPGEEAPHRDRGWLKAWTLANGTPMRNRYLGERDVCVIVGVGSVGDACSVNTVTPQI